MKEIVLKLYEFDELSKDSQERIIERERWNIMDCCMEAYGADYISTMKSFGDLTNTEAHDGRWTQAAEELVSSCGLTEVECRELQEESGSFNDEMLEFIDMIFGHTDMIGEGEDDTE